MHAISSYRGNRHRPPQTLSARCKHRTPARHKHTQTGPITIHCAASPLPNLDSHNQYLHLATFNIPYQHIILDSGPYIHCLPFTIFNILCTLETFYHFAIEYNISINYLVSFVRYFAFRLLYFNKRIVTVIVLVVLAQLIHTCRPVSVSNTMRRFCSIGGHGY